MKFSDILAFFRRRKPEEQEVSIESLLDDLATLLAKNQVGYAENEREIDRVKVFEQDRVERIKAGVSSEHMKRIVLREVLGLRKRLGSLERVSRVYQQNIDIHLVVEQRLEDQLATGMKVITQDQLQNIVLDHEEQLVEHREVMLDNSDYIGDDSSLLALEKEIEEEYNEID
jgi:hypothetical protein